jgi:DsbE subfamily thiol:disulfide oxidoreductase
MSKMLPLWTFLILVGFFAYRLLLIDEGDAPNLISSVMVGKPAPDFNLPPLFEDGGKFATADLKNKVTLINFFASWCIPCRTEHQYLSGLTGKEVVLVGFNYKNDPADAKEWLGRFGNPYNKLVADHEGLAAINFGVYGVPESYLIDKNGIIRFKQTGPITPEIIEKQLLPMIKELNK